MQTISADFNKDGLLDYVTCGFGRNIGGLYLFIQQKDHSYKKTIVRDAPGGEQIVTGDFNNDGYPDLMCLFAQADEGIWMFLNDKKGGFTTKNILHFPLYTARAVFSWLILTTMVNRIFYTLAATTAIYHPY